LMLEDLQPMTVERTLMRLVALAAARGGTLAANEVEDDEQLARDRRLTNAAARMLAAGVGVSAEAAESGWFPFRLLTLNDVSQPAVEAEHR
jgi:hypothetical protein